MESLLQKIYPWVSTPLIASAPMGGFAGPKLAAAVTASGGIGFIAGGYNTKRLSSQLGEAQVSLNDVTSGLHKTPLGVGFLCFTSQVEEVSPIIAKYQPAAAWLSSARQNMDYAEWAKALRTASPHTTIWIQIGSVSAAVEVAKTAKPDVLVLQGIDAGGHGLAKGAGIISLLPEVADALREIGLGSIPLLAAGGIMEARGTTAALFLGASGVVMGTRFLCSEEVQHPHSRPVQKILLQARDGGQSTVRSTLFDEIKPEGNTWPSLYDGRGLVNQTYEDLSRSGNMTEVKRRYAEALQSPGGGYTEAKTISTVWAGTGVGLVNSVLPAGEILMEVRRGVHRLMRSNRL